MAAQMRDVARRLGRQSAAYSLASVIGPGAGLLLLAVYTRYLSPADYGLIALLEIVSLLLGTVFSLGMAAMVPFYYTDQPDPVLRRRCLGTLVIGLTALNGVLALLLWTAGRPLLGLLLPSVPFSPFVPVVIFTALLDPYWIIAGAVLQIQERALLYSLLTVGRIVVSAGLRITWVVALDGGVLGFVTANLQAAALMAVVASVLLRREVAIAFMPRELWRAFLLGGPTVPNNLLSYAFRTIDRVVMDRFATREQIGQYYMALRLAEVLRVAADVVINAWRPIFFKEAGSPEFPERIVPRVVRLGSMGFITIFVGLALFASELLMILTTPEYWGAMIFAPVLLGAMTLKGLLAFSYLVIWYRRRTIYIPALTLITLVFSIVANLVLASRWGAYGVAIALLLSWALFGALVLGVAKRLYPIVYPWRDIGWASVFAAVVVALGGALEPGMTTVALKLVLLGSFVVAMIGSRCVSLGEIRAIAEPARALVRGEATTVAS